MNLNLQNWFAVFENFSVREQILVGITGAGVIMFVLQVSFIDPILVKEKAISQKILASKVLNDGYKRQLASDNHSNGARKLAQIQHQVDKMKEDIESLDIEVNQFLSVMVPAQDMPDLLQVVLNQNALQLVSLENIAPKPVAVQSEENGLDQKVDSNQLFHHGLVIKVRGEYHSILSYIKELEGQKWKLNWQSIVYEVGTYPMGEVEIKVETLSKEKGWLGV
jgi:MSHA biogenesis protein MshJ